VLSMFVRGKAFGPDHGDHLMSRSPDLMPLPLG
jgi:hypothetical protein